MVVDKSLPQIFEYNKVSFHYVQCQLYGHMVKECSKHFTTNVWHIKANLHDGWISNGYFRKGTQWW